MVKIPSLAEMLKAGVHFGHQRSRWHPKMEPYIFGVRNGVHIIDLEKTQVELSKVLHYATELTSKGKKILFVGTKRQARAAVQAAAEACGMPYLVERWVGGLLTNFDEFKKRLKKYQKLHAEFASGEIERYTKKEQVRLKKQLDKMDKYLKGLTGLDALPDAMYVADMRVEKTAITEARATRTPVIAVVDTNVDPTKITHPIPANDDAVNAVKMIADAMAQAVQEGKVLFEKAKAAIVVEKAAVVEKKENVVPKKEARPMRKDEVV